LDTSDLGSEAGVFDAYRVDGFLATRADEQ